MSPQNTGPGSKLRKLVHGKGLPQGHTGSVGGTGICDPSSELTTVSLRLTHPSRKLHGCEFSLLPSFCQWLSEVKMGSICKY